MKPYRGFLSISFWNGKFECSEVAACGDGSDALTISCISDEPEFDTAVHVRYGPLLEVTREEARRHG